MSVGQSRGRSQRFELYYIVPRTSLETFVTVVVEDTRKKFIVYTYAAGLSGRGVNGVCEIARKRAVNICAARELPVLVVFCFQCADLLGVGRRYVE